MATIAKINKVTSSANSTTNILYGLDLSTVCGLLTTATTAIFTYSNDQGKSTNTITFTVTGGTPTTADMAKDTLITANTAGEKLKNVSRIVNWFMAAVNGSKNAKTHKIWGGTNELGLTQGMITTEAGLTFGGAATEPLVSIVVA